MKTQTGYADLGGFNLYYEMAGEGEALMLAHAGFLDSRMWDDQWEAFAGQYRVIRYDLQGYGRSDVATGAVSRRAELAALLDHLGVARAHLVGVSLSGTSVIDFALEHPERVLSLTVVSSTPSGFEMQGEPPPLVLEMMGAYQAGEVVRASELQLRIWFDGEYRTADQVDGAARARAAVMNQIAVANGTWATADLEPLDPLDPPAAGRLGELRMPVLIIAGALDHPELVRAAEVMAAAIGQAQKVIMANSAHTPNMDAPEAFTGIVRGFLQGAAVGG